MVSAKSVTHEASALPSGQDKSLCHLSPRPLASITGRIDSGLPSFFSSRDDVQRYCTVQRAGIPIILLSCWHRRRRRQPDDGGWSVRQLWGKRWPRGWRRGQAQELHGLSSRQVLRRGLPEAHRKQHKKECKKRAAELKDEQLYSQGHERPEGNFCPICTLPIPLPMGATVAA